VTGNSQESTQARGKLEDSGIVQQEQKTLVQEEKRLIIEELCGRDMGKRTFTITPTHQFSSDPIDLAAVIRNVETTGYKVKTRGNLGVTAISGNDDKDSTNTNSSTISVSFLTSGAATIVGAKSEHEALALYQTFMDG
jgi:adenylyltransferase/sulfurtransferase